ncbi:helix-turn-helix domain-containing protein [Alcaligenaceae bacterium]|nr:helix-turn-helix domain-containing protein [Alcaligenaceae bacterium]
MDWKNIILSLVSHGLTQAQIAKESGVSQPTIAGLLSGAQRDMRWENGDRLLALYRKVYGADRPTKDTAHA